MLGKACNSTSVLEALPGKLDIKSHSPSILYVSASLAMSTRVLEAMPGKLDIKILSPSFLCILTTHAPIGTHFVLYGLIHLYQLLL